MPRDRALTELTIALRVSRGYLLDGREPFEMSEEEFALSKSRLAGGTLMESVMREDATPYRTPDSPEVLLRDEIMAALNGAQLSPDELRRKTLHQRIDDYLDVLKAKKP